jgi:hypothetical protein
MTDENFVVDAKFMRNAFAVLSYGDRRLKDDVV